MREQKFTNIFELAERAGVQLTDIQLLIKRNKISIHESRGYLVLNSESVPDNDESQISLLDPDHDPQFYQSYMDE